MSTLKLESLQHPDSANENIILNADGSVGGELATTLASKADKSAGYQYHSTIYYTSSGTFTKASYPWLRAIRVKCQGAGGGGGGCATSGTSQAAAGSGGGAGAYGEVFIDDIESLSASITVTVGAGGTGGIGSTATSGGTGGTSSFGIYSANGGAGGQHGVTQTSPFAEPFGGGGSETSANMDFTVFGENGLGATIVNVTRATFQGAALAGNGGNSFLGKGGRPGNAAAGGVNPGFLGGGGGGRNIGNDGASSGNGASGGNGIVIVELYA